MDNDKKIEQDLKDYIQTIAELSDEQKKKYADMLDGGESELVVLDEIDKLLQSGLDEAFREAGVEMDENDPQYIAEHQKMLTEVEDAGREYDEKIRGIEKEATDLEASTARQIDEVGIEAIKQKMK